MSLLTAIWVTAIALCSSAVLWMLVLILLRVWTARSARRRAADRRAVESCFIGVLQGRVDIHHGLAPYLGRGRLIAEALLDFLTVVRGVDMEAIVAALRSLGVDKTLFTRIRRGSLAGRLATIEALGAFPGEETCTALTSAVDRGPPSLRLAALRSLLQAGGKVTLARLLDHLSRGELGHSGPLAELAQIVVEGDPMAAIGALARDDLATATQIMLIEALGRAGAYAAIPAIDAHTQAKGADLRAAAITTLGGMMHPFAEPAIRRALTDPAWEVRAAAAIAVGEASLTSLIPALGDRLSDTVWSVRFKSAGALLKLGEPGRRRLEAALAGDDATAAQTASLVLAERGTVPWT